MAYTRTDARVLNRAVTAAGGKLPDTLANLLAAADEIHAASNKPATDPLAGLADAAAAGKATANKIRATFDQAGTQAAQAAQAQRTQREAENAVMSRFRRELVNGGADQILDSLRPVFDEHIAAIRAIAADINVASHTPESFLNIATPETLPLWQSIGTHVEALDRIAAVTDLFSHTGEARVIPRPDGGPHLIGSLNAFQGRSIYCISDQLDLGHAHDIWRTNGPHRRSAWFKLYSVAQLRTVAEATERLRDWCEVSWDAFENARPARHTSVNGELVQDPPRPNPFRVEETV
ncbi:hypothetical protein [Mycolicibacterium elephantis]